MIEEEKYLEIREKLRNLPKLKASEGFAAKLQSKILNIEAEKNVYQNQNLKSRSEGGFFQHIFGRQQNTWLIPASGFAIILIIAGIFYFSQGDDSVQLAGTQPETSEQELVQNTGEKEPVSDADLKEMQKEPVVSENLADNIQTETTENLTLTQPDPVSSDRTSTIQNESRVRPEIKIDTEVESVRTQQSEEKINEEFKTSTAIENMGARSKNEDRGSNINKRGDTNSSLRSKRSPIQVSTIKQVELESLKEKVSDQ